MSAVTPRRRRLLANATRDLNALREEWNATMAQHHLRVDAQFKELAARLKARPKGRQPKGLPTTEQAAAISELLGQARLKPAKGRAKDLRRVERLLDSAFDRLPEQD